MLLIIVLAGFGVGAVAPLLNRAVPTVMTGVALLTPLLIAGWFLSQMADIVGGTPVTFSYPWVPSIGIDLSFYLDGLGMLFGLLISGIGVVVVLCSPGHLGSRPALGRYYLFLFSFMGSMLGTVLADDVVTLFVFWELTSLTSYFLIGFDHEREPARKAALQALLVTGLGGVALLAGLLMLGQAAGSYRLSEMVSADFHLGDHGLYLPILFLIALGAFTKSAQFPFHFWLPNAMEAPTPVSAYLHSSTMVKAGVYLLARMSPTLGGTAEWLYLVAGVGLATTVAGAYLALRETRLKRLLAYSTVSALGLMVMLLGVGSAAAVSAAMTFLVAHALYKAALFFVAGNVRLATGKTKLGEVGGLGGQMAGTAAVAGLAGLSMAGLPPFMGFIGKESIYEATLNAPGALAATLAALFAGAVYVAIAIKLGYGLFFADRRNDAGNTRDVDWRLWAGPLLLSALGLVGGLLPSLPGDYLVRPAAASILSAIPSEHFGLWHGFSRAFVLSGITFLGGLLIYLNRRSFVRVGTRDHALFRWGPNRFYDLCLKFVNALAWSQTRVLQHGYLRLYLLVIVSVTAGLTWMMLLAFGEFQLPQGWDNPRIHEPGIAIFILLAIFVTVRSRSRLAAIAALGMVGYGIGVVFVFFRAPDLALTQFAVETLTVVLFLLAFYKLPSYALLSSTFTRVRDGLLAASIGALMTYLTLMASAIQSHPAISDYYMANSLSKARGRNIVNVILVDFRGFDTMGEITVLAIAGIGASALLSLGIKRGRG